MTTWIKLAIGVLTLTGCFTLITTKPSSATSETPARPADQLVNDFDRAIQQRFVVIPSVGIVRIEPVNPPNPHLKTFQPETPHEQQAVDQFASQKWTTGIYLFGRRAYEDNTVAPGKKKLNIYYRSNDPVPVSADLKVKDMTDSKQLVDHIERAYDAFLTKPSYEFQQGKWSYVARPVAAREGCLKCHGDMFITAKLDNKRWAYRPRQVGDPIGVLVYAFRSGK